MSRPPKPRLARLYTPSAVYYIGPAMPAAPRFAGRVALVTGASRGIGRAIARAFAAEGAAVGVFSAHAEGARAVADEIAAAGGRALPVVGDVSIEDDVRRVVAQAERSLGPIDVLVNNAGITGPTAPAVALALEDWERVLAVNLTGPFLCARHVLSVMLRRDESARRRAAIINIGSIAGKISYPQRAPYASAKWGLIGFTLTLAEEVGASGIRVNCVCPGPVAGELIEEVFRVRARAMGLPVEQVREKFLSATMLKRLVTPEEIAAAVLFLASDDAAGITGQAIDVSGGLAFLRS
jgi:NAD(P)-dependent dehydrogenase (short-subunit alcohol dehydrogenase family)